VVVGVARAAASLEPERWGTDARAWGAHVSNRNTPMMLHAGKRSAIPVFEEVTIPRAVWCTADLHADTLQFECDYEKGGPRAEWPALTVVIPQLAECFVYASKYIAGAVTLLLPDE
jgi:hypothetical protein